MRSRYITYTAAALAGVAVLLITVLVTLKVADNPGRGEPTVVTTYYAEKSGRQCSQTVAHTASDVSVSVSCSWPPAESRIADLLEGAGQ